MKQNKITLATDKKLNDEIESFPDKWNVVVHSNHHDTYYDIIINGHLRRIVSWNETITDIMRDKSKSIYDDDLSLNKMFEIALKKELLYLLQAINESKK